MSPSPAPPKGSFAVRSSAPFVVGMFVLGGAYVLLIGLMVLADVLFLVKPVPDAAVVSRNAGMVRIANESGRVVVFIEGGEGGASRRYDIPAARQVVVPDTHTVRKGIKLTDGELAGTDALYCAFVSPAIQYAIVLSLVSSTIAMILALLVAVPIGYVMSRFEFRGKALVDTILDIPIVMPPLVIGISLIILFRFPPFEWIRGWVAYEKPAIILAQFAVAAAFAARTMRVAFNQIPQRYEHVAMTSGCSRSEAFRRVVLPQARHGLLAAATLAWARSLGEFGPILVFAGATPYQTEVLPTSIYFEMQNGNVPGMLAIALIMIAAATIVLLTARVLGLKGGEL